MLLISVPRYQVLPEATIITNFFTFLPEIIFVFIGFIGICILFPFP